MQFSSETQTGTISFKGLGGGGGGGGGCKFPLGKSHLVAYIISLKTY